MKKILFLVFFIPAFVSLVSTVYGKGTGSTDAGIPDDGSVPFSEETAPPDPGALPSGMQEPQPAVMGDPDLTRAADGLISDADFQALADDPEVMDAAKSLDLKTLMANPKFAHVVNGPAGKDIGEKIDEQE